MESTSEVVWKEQTKSSVSKKSIQEVSATSVQKLSSTSSLVGEKNVLSILGSDNAGGIMLTSPTSPESPLTLTATPIITSPAVPEDGNVMNTSSLQSEFSAMKLKDEQGNEIGEMIQQKEQRESKQASSAVIATDSGNVTSVSSAVKHVSSMSSSSVVQQQTASSVVAKAQETSSSSSSSVPTEVESQREEKTTTTPEQTVVDAPVAENNKQENLNNTIKDIISSIDSNIKAEENIAALKERELELLKKQQELAREIEQQKLLAQKLASENQLKQQQYNNSFAQQQYQQQQESSIPVRNYQPLTNVSKYSTFEEKQDENVYSRKSETFETRESTNVSKKIDLHKIFTPATDAEEILPKNRKLYASSAFYSPTLHPTVEDQVELARRISHSLSDISNQQSRGQSMYVNRKKRSVKWVHEGCGQETDNLTITQQEEYDQEEKENDVVSHHDKIPLKFLMNPSGQMRDINSLRESLNTETGLLSPDVSAEVVTALQAQKGKGAELFAKRRKVSEKWVVDESNVGAQSPSGLPDYHQYQQQPRPSTSPSILPAYTDAAKHRVQLNLHQEQLLEKYAKPGLKVVQTPWEAALNSGSASAAFVEEQKLSPYHTSTLTPSPTPQLYDASQGSVPIQSEPTVPDSYSKSYSTDDYHKYPATSLQQTHHERQHYTGTNSQRELAYKPSIPQGWKAPSMSLPKDLYMPKEIPLQSYAPPPVAAASPISSPPFLTNYETNHSTAYKPMGSSASPLTSYSIPEPAPTKSMPYGGGASSFPISKPYQPGFASTYGSTQPPKQQYLPPQSYQKIPQNTSQNVPQVSFNPSPLPYDKLAKFENQATDDDRYNMGSPSTRSAHLNVRGSKVRNTSPAPFAAGPYNRPYTPSTDSHRYGATPSPSPRPLSSTHQYGSSGYNTPNPTHPTVTSNQILNAPSYNSSARGWGCSAATGYQNPQSHFAASKPQMVNSSSMPYTDF